eukprot:m.638 g.638  ORF g.638 m.638 type:complete len:58 (+) comp288_c1_seq1:466-639(+)
MIRSRKLFRYGFIEVKMAVPPETSVSSGLWLQSRETEVNALAINGNILTTEGYNTIS